MISGDHHSLVYPACEGARTRLPFLVELSPKDKLWDMHRREAEGYAQLYSQTEYSKYADRIRECAQRLFMSLVLNPLTGELELHLDSTWCCRVPRCPICAWRKSMKWEARVFKVMPKILAEYPEARFLFLTLTIRTCPLEELRATITQMNKAWQRMTDRKSFPAIGWIRKVEVNRSADDKAHAHFHILLMVKPSYYGKGYITQKRWRELWQESMRLDYEPIIDIRRADGRVDGQIDKKSILETLNYSLKPEDILRPDQNHPTKNVDWLVELTRQLHKMRLLSTAGVFKEHLRELEEQNDNEDLIHINEDELDTENGLKAGKLVFTWSQNIRRYIQEVDKWEYT